MNRICALLMTGMILLLACGVQAQMADQISMSAERVSVNYNRSQHVDWTVQVHEFTPFVPVDPSLPEPFFFDDLQVEYGVLIEGHVSPQENLILADIVFVFSDVNHYPRFAGGPPPPPGERIFGIVNSIDNQNLSFHIWVSGFQGNRMDVIVVPEAEFWDAPIGAPRLPITLWDFHPGDPVMIHGVMTNDRFFGNAFVRSLDWFGERSSNGESTVMEIYGWVHDIVHHPPGSLIMNVDVDSMTGDPNHQSVSKIIGPEGGYINFPWGHLMFPAGALNDYVNIQVTGDFMFWWTLENVYQFYPSMEFNLPVEIEIRYFNLQEFNPDQIRLTWFDETTNTWRLACHMTHHWDQHCFRGFINHFSRYSLSTNNRPLQGTPLQPAN